MYRASRAQHSIPEQQHYVCDDDAAQGGSGLRVESIFFKRKEWTQLARRPFGECVHRRFDACLP